MLGRGFMPTEADKGLLSGYNSEQINPGEAYQHRTEIMGKQSAGIWAVSFEEIELQQLPREQSPTETAPSHIHVDFNRFEAKLIKAKAAILADLASQRGIRYPTEATGETPLLPIIVDAV